VLPPNGEALLTSGDPPTLWFIGPEDPSITDENRAVHNAVVLWNAGVISVPEVIEGAGHVPVNDEFGPTIYSQSANFLYLMMDLGHAAGAQAG
jgi:hypothetical protein